MNQGSVQAMTCPMPSSDTTPSTASTPSSAWAAASTVGSASIRTHTLRRRNAVRADTRLSPGRAESVAARIVTAMNAAMGHASGHVLRGRPRASRHTARSASATSAVSASVIETPRPRT